MNHPSQFAQPFSWGIAAKAADAGPLLLASAAIIHDQMYDDRRAGQLVGECSRHAPVRVLYDRGRGAFMHTGRGFGLGIFSAEGRGCNPRLANVETRRSGILKCISQRLPSHSSAPSFNGPTLKPEMKDAVPQERAFGTRHDC